MIRRVFLLDNYDSFTWNLVQLLGRIGAEVAVARNDELTVEEVRQLAPEAIVISPGPSRPERAGISVDLVRDLGPTTPVLGVCLGHQPIGAPSGPALVRGPPVPRKTPDGPPTRGGPFPALPSPITAARYHSLAIDRATLPPDLEVTAWSDDGVVMGVRHKSHPVEGFQFHPESILTDDGEALLTAFLARIPEPAASGVRPPRDDS